MEWPAGEYRAQGNTRSSIRVHLLGDSRAQNGHREGDGGLPRGSEMEEGCRWEGRWRTAAGDGYGGQPLDREREAAAGKETEEAAARRKTELRPCRGRRLERMQGNTERGGFVSGVGARKAIECRVLFVSNSVSDFPRRPNGRIDGGKFQFPIPPFNANNQTQP
jgi:hypothetical protein